MYKDDFLAQCLWSEHGQSQSELSGKEHVQEEHRLKSMSTAPHLYKLLQKAAILEAIETHKIRCNLHEKTKSLCTYI